MHIVVFSHLRWDFVYQRPQQLLSRLGSSHNIWFVEEPVNDADHPWLELVKPDAGVTVLRPHTEIEAAGFDDKQMATLRAILVTRLATCEIEDFVAWFYTPMALPLIDGLHPRAIVYDCMDELSAFKNAPPQLRQREADLLKRADLVLTGGPSLYNAKRAFNPNVKCVPSAVDADHYSPRMLSAPSPLEAEAAQLRVPTQGPCIGFFGVIDERLDIELLQGMVAARPNWQFVMVGPVVKIDPAVLPQAANLHWLGQRPYGLLPFLVQHWDVCILPFALNEATRFISPTKTLEYLAAEKPVISTPVLDVVDLYGDVIRIASDTASFVSACEELLAESSAERAQRIARARDCVARHSWDSAAHSVGVALETVIARRSSTFSRTASTQPAPGLAREPAEPSAALLDSAG